MFRKRDFDRRAFLDGERPFHFNGDRSARRGRSRHVVAPVGTGQRCVPHERLSRFRIHSEQAQARTDVVARSIAGIRALQHQWVELGLVPTTAAASDACVQPFPPQ